MRLTFVRIGYFGSPDISAELLTALIEDGHDVAFVVSNPDRPRGRSGKLTPTATSTVALQRGIPLFRYERLKDAPDQSPAKELARFACELYVVFAYGKLLPKAIFESPALGTVNLHASLLPLLRGASPIQSAVLSGFAVTGWTLQQMAAELDSGDIISATELPIGPNETSGELTERMLPAGIQLTLATLRDFARLRAERRPQDHAAATFCSKFTTAGATIDWHASAADIHNLVRALNPWPMARTDFRGKIVRILGTRLNTLAENQLPGAQPAQVLTLKLDGRQRLFAGTGSGVLEIVTLQMENRRAMNAHDFLNGVVLGTEAYFGR